MSKMFWAEIFLAITMAALSVENIMAQELKYKSINRAPDAVVSASSFRRGTMSEVLGGSVLLYAPQVWNHWIPSYAADRDSETFWASERGDTQWLELELGNRLINEVPISRIVIRWGKDRPGKYSVSVSSDRTNYQPLKEYQFEGGDQRIIELETPVSARFLKLEFPQARDGVSVREILVFGPDQEKLPGPAIEVKAEALSNQEIRLSWKYADNSPPAYLFKIYRGTAKDFPADRARLIEETDRTEFLDQALQPGTTYYYKVLAEGFSGDRNLSGPVVSAMTRPGAAYSRMPIHGVIEGFYNQPWPHTERVRLLRFLARSGFNHYLYAPKNDPWHRQLWRESYPDDEKKNFRELADAGNALGIAINYGISPGLSINYNDPAEVEKLKAKLKEMFDLGIRNFTLCLDDIPDSNKADRKMALDQVKLVNEIQRFLLSLDPKCRLFFCPTVYSFPYSHWVNQNKNFAAYLETLAQLDPEVMIMWTGPTQTFSDIIDLKSAAEYQKLWNRPILVWDNYPVNDVSLQKNIFLGPYLGRDPKLGEAVAGIFSNPMFIVNANRLPLFTMGKYFTDENYDPWKAYQEAMPVVGKGAEIALKDLSDCLLSHPMFPSRSISTLPVKKQIDQFWTAYQTGNYEKEEAQLRELFQRYSKNPDELEKLENQRLWYELKPASEKLSLFGQASLKALEYMETKDAAKRAELKNEAHALLKQAKKNPWKVATPSVSPLYRLIGAKPENQPVFEAFVKAALKK